MAQESGAPRIRPIRYHPRRFIVSTALRLFLSALTSVLWLTETRGQTAPVDSDLAPLLNSVSSSRMLADVRQLSGPEFSGRQTGTVDDLRSALVLATHFHALGLLPAGDRPLGPGNEPWAMAEPVLTTVIDRDAALSFSSHTTTHPAQVGSDFLPVLDSPAVRVSALVVFVGYGISDPARGFDDYAGTDVQNRIVLFLRGKPASYPGSISHADKERTAREQGALAFLTVTGPVVSSYEAKRGIRGNPSAFYTLPDGDRPLPGAWISTAYADRLITAAGESLSTLQGSLGTPRQPHSFDTHMLASLSWSSTQAPGTLLNVLGLLPGVGPLADEVIILGAHRDHFGKQAGLLFAGADDNASGTAVVLEAARVLSQHQAPSRRTILFVSFSGEEQGLLGSRRYVRTPSRPLRSTVAMINVDHAGIGNGKVTVGVTGLEQVTATEIATTAGLADTVEVFGFFPGGDHVPFKEAGVPTITIVSSGIHPHFHQATDTADTIQPAILLTTARYAVATAWHLATTPSTRTMLHPK